MYYNIKITSKNCEFALESSDRAIISNEMDSYFDLFYGASEEFRARLKKISITNNNISLNVKNESEKEKLLNCELKSIILGADLLDEVPKEDVLKTQISTTIKDEPISILSNFETLQKITPETEKKDELSTKNLSEKQTAQKPEINISHQEPKDLNIQSISTNTDKPKEISIQNTSATLQIKNEPLVNQTQDIVSIRDNKTQEAVFETIPTIEFQHLNKESEKPNSVQENTQENTQENVQDCIKDIIEEETSILADMVVFENINTATVNEKVEEDNETKGVTLETVIDDICSKIEEREKEAENISLKEISTQLSQDTQLKTDIITSDNFIVENNEENFGQEAKEEDQSELEIIMNDEETQEDNNEFEIENMIKAAQEKINSINIMPIENKEEEIAPELDKKENQEEKSNVLDDFRPNKEEIEQAPIIELSQDNSKEENKNEEKEETIQNNPQISKEEPDFGVFVSNFTCQVLEDLFLACAYYIKNITNVNSFTMKELNAKLFKATGKIAGISVASMLINKGFLEQEFDSEGNKKYYITDSGEDYFMNQFQG